MPGAALSSSNPHAMHASPSHTDTIAAVATAAGAGGVGIVRLSGPRARQIAKAMGAGELAPRQARYARFVDGAGEVIDDGIALAFVAPASFTGEDVVELQAHGSPVVLRALVARACALGARRRGRASFPNAPSSTASSTWPRPRRWPT